MLKPPVRASHRIVSGRTIVISLVVAVWAVAGIQRTAYSQPSLALTLREDYVVPSGQIQQLPYDLPNSDFSFATSNIPGGENISGGLSTFAADQQDFYDSYTAQSLRFNIFGDGLVAGDVLTVQYAFIFTFSEGSIGTADIKTDEAGESGLPVTSGQLISGEFSEPPLTGSINDEFSDPFDQLEIDFGWSSVKPTDTLTLTFPTGAFNVFVSQAPEPATASMSCFAALALAQRRRRSRLPRRI